MGQDMCVCRDVTQSDADVCGLHCNTNTTVYDNCGHLRVCGACGTGYTCVSNVCQCSDLHNNNTVCGTHSCGTMNDLCGVARDCGTCTTPTTCGGGGSQGVCGCTDARSNLDVCNPKNCGFVNDTCNVARNCGTCSSCQQCNSGTCAENTVCSSDGDCCGLNWCSSGHCCAEEYGWNSTFGACRRLTVCNNPFAVDAICGSLPNFCCPNWVIVGRNGETAPGCCLINATS